MTRRLLASASLATVASDTPFATRSRSGTPVSLRNGTTTTLGAPPTEARSVRKPTTAATRTSTPAATAIMRRDAGLAIRRVGGATATDPVASADPVARGIDTATGATNRYPRVGTVSTNVGEAALSRSADRRRATQKFRLRSKST